MSSAIERLQRFCEVGLFDAYADGKNSLVDDVQHIVAIAMARDSAANKDLPGPKPCQARAERHRP